MQACTCLIEVVLPSYSRPCRVMPLLMVRKVIIFQVKANYECLVACLIGLLPLFIQLGDHPAHV